MGGGGGANSETIRRKGKMFVTGKHSTKETLCDEDTLQINSV